MFDELNYVRGLPKASGVIKMQPEDFFVEEQLGFELTGEGEHLFLQIEKTLLNTEEMAREIARHFAIPQKMVSYAGMKDKYATTIQWFSVHLPGKKDPGWQDLQSDNYRVLQASRHNKKLKTGALAGNFFKIRIGDFVYDPDEILEQLERVKSEGVPNYFGSQRFGQAGSNIERAKNLLLNGKKVKNRHLRGLYYSTARSLLFNELLSARVLDKIWNQPLLGDLMMLSGTNSVFSVDEVTDDLIQRTKAHDISPALPLWGKGEERVNFEALNFQNSVLDKWQSWCNALEAHDLRKAYRAAVLVPDKLKLVQDCFEFYLPKGSYATVLLRELVNLGGN